MIGKGIRGRIFHAIYQYTETSNKYMKDFYKIKDYNVLYIGICIICMDGEC